MLHSPNALVAVSSSGVGALVGEVLSFLALPHGWCYGKGGPADLNAVMEALRLLRVLQDLGYDRIEAFPDPAGGVLLSAFYGDDSVEILCLRGGGRYEFVLERNGCEADVRENVDQEHVLGSLWDLSCALPKKSSDCCIQGSTANISIGSKVWHLEIPTTVYLSSTVHAQSLQAGRFAHTYRISTQTFPVSRQYTGEYQQAVSQIMQNLSQTSLVPATNVISWSSGSRINSTETGFA